MMPRPKPLTVVRLRSGGPHLVVLDVARSRVKVMWTAEGATQVADFDARMLERVEGAA